MSTWEKAAEGDSCSECGEELEVGQEVLCVGADTYCEGCGEDVIEAENDGDIYDDMYDDRSMFANPGGNSALRAETEDNPRNLPCPSCHRPNLLTPADRACGYQCDSCADRDEGTGD